MFKTSIFLDALSADILAEKVALIPGIQVDYQVSGCTEQKAPLDKELRSDSALIGLVVIVTARVMVPALNALKEVLIEHIKSKFRTITIVRPDGAKISISGPIGNKREEDRLKEDIVKLLQSECKGISYASE